MACHLSSLPQDPCHPLCWKKSTLGCPATSQDLKKLDSFDPLGKDPSFLFLSLILNSQNKKGLRICCLICMGSQLKTEGDTACSSPWLLHHRCLSQGALAFSGASRGCLLHRRARDIEISWLRGCEHGLHGLCQTAKRLLVEEKV